LAFAASQPRSPSLATHDPRRAEDDQDESHAQCDALPPAESRGYPDADPIGGKRDDAEANPDDEQDTVPHECRASSANGRYAPRAGARAGSSRMNSRIQAG
jgi:hypothetical protein